MKFPEKYLWIIRMPELGKNALVLKYQRLELKTLSSRRIKENWLNSIHLIR